MIKQPKSTELNVVASIETISYDVNKTWNFTCVPEHPMSHIDDESSLQEGGADRFRAFHVTKIGSRPFRAWLRVL